MYVDEPTKVWNSTPIEEKRLVARLTREMFAYGYTLRATRDEYVALRQKRLSENRPTGSELYEK